MTQAFQQYVPRAGNLDPVGDGVAVPVGRLPVNVVSGVAGLDSAGKLQPAQFPSSWQIQFRQGTLAALQAMVLASGEPAWATDTKAFFVGDGTTSGGVSVGGQYSAISKFIGYDPNGNGGTGSGDGLEFAADGIHRRGTTTNLPLKLEVKGNGYVQLFGANAPSAGIGNNSIDLQIRRSTTAVEVADAYALGANNRVRSSHCLAIGEDNVVSTSTTNAAVIGVGSTVSGTTGANVHGSTTTAGNAGNVLGSNAYQAGVGGTIAGDGGMTGTVVASPRNQAVTLSGTTVTWAGDHTVATGDAAIDEGSVVYLFGFNVASDGIKRVTASGIAFGGANTTFTISAAPSGSPTAALLSIENSGGTANNVAFGRNAKAIGANSTAFGTTQRNYVDNAINISGPPILRKDTGDVATGVTGFRLLAGTDVILCSNLIDFKTTATKTITFPSGARFYPTNCGIIAHTISGLVTQPTIQMGITGTTNKHRASAITTKLTQSHKRDETAVTTDDGETSLSAQITGAANATTFQGFFYWRGLLVEE